MAECPQQPTAERQLLRGKQHPTEPARTCGVRCNCQAYIHLAVQCIPLCMVCLAVSKASFLVELTVSFIVYAGCISCSGIV